MLEFDKEWTLWRKWLEARGQTAGYKGSNLEELRKSNVFQFFLASESDDKDVSFLDIGTL